MKEREREREKIQGEKASFRFGPASLRYVSVRDFAESSCKDRKPEEYPNKRPLKHW